MEIKKSTVYKRLFVANILVAIFLIATLDFYFVKKLYLLIKRIYFYLQNTYLLL